MRSAQATTSPSGVDGAGRRQEWLRTPSSVSAQVERRERDVGAVDGVVVAAGHVGRERLLRAWPAGPCPQSCASAIASTSGRHRLAARAIPVATCATSTAWVSRVRRWSSSGAMNTWHFPASRRHGRECLMRSRSRSKHSRYGSGVSAAGPARADRARRAGGANAASSSASAPPGIDGAPDPRAPAHQSARARWTTTPAHIDRTRGVTPTPRDFAWSRATMTRR